MQSATECKVGHTLIVDRAVSPRRFIVLPLSGFAGFALLLASLGIALKRSSIRMALGASPNDVQSRIVARTRGMAAVGTLAGVGIAWLLVRSVKKFPTEFRLATQSTSQARLVLPFIAALPDTCSPEEHPG